MAFLHLSMGDFIVSTLVSRSSGPSLSLELRTLCCFIGQDTTLTVPLSTQVHKWVPSSLLLGVPCDGLASHPGGSRNTITLTYYRNREKHLPDGLLGLYADLTFTFDL